jgi:DNA repair exonuclease SbcCD ATPase subunit
MSIGKVTFDFTPEIVLLLGRNLDSMSADDNGAGKSTIAEALRWALYGETCRSAIDKSLTVEHVIRNGAKAALVAVDMDIAGVPYTVKRMRTKTSGKLEVKVGGSLHEGKAAQQILAQTLGIDIVQFSNLVHLDGSYPKLFAPTTDRDRKDILADLVEIAMVEKMQQTATSRCKDVDAQLSAVEEQLTKLSYELSRYTEDVRRYADIAKQQFDALQEAEEKVKKYSAHVAKLKGAKKQLTTQLGEVQEAGTETIDSLKDRVASLEREITTLEEKLEEATENFCVAEIDACRRQLNIAESNKKFLEGRIKEVKELHSRGECPTCGQATDDLVDKEIPKLETLVGGLNDDISQAKGSLQGFESKRRKKLSTFKDDLQSKRTESQAQRAKINALVAENEEERNLLRDKLSQVNERLIEATKQLATAESVKKTSATEMKEARQQRLIAKTKVTELTEKVSELGVTKGKLNQTKEDLEFWKRGFGPKGVPSLFIETVLPSISSRIQQYADVLTGGDVVVKLLAYRETKSQTVQEAIQISAVNSKGASVYGANSTGERNRINLAVTLGLIDYFRDMGVFESNLLICDEIFDGLDSTGVEQALLALQESHIPSVLVVSHHDHFKPLFANTIYVKKERGVSSLEV